MSDTVARRRPLIIWTTFIVVALVVAAVVWLVLANRSDGSAAANPTTSSTPVPATPSEWPTPTPGSTSVMPSIAPTQAPIDETVDMGGLSSTVTSLVRFDAKDSSIPGEVAGPAIRVTVEVTNTSTKPIDIDGARLSATFGKSGVVGAELSGNGTKDFPASIQPGETVKAVAAFSLPEGVDDSVHVELDLLAGKPVIVFVGDVPKA